MRNAAYHQARLLAQEEGFSKEPFLLDIVHLVLDMRDRQWEAHLFPYEVNLDKLIQDLFFITAHQDGDHGIERYDKYLRGCFNRYLREHPDTAFLSHDDSQDEVQQRASVSSEEADI